MLIYYLLLSNKSINDYSLAPYKWLSNSFANSWGNTFEKHPIGIAKYSPNTYPNPYLTTHFYNNKVDYFKNCSSYNCNL